MKSRKLLALVAIMAIMACKKDPKPGSNPISQNPGIFVLNEGPFSAGNGSLSYIDLSNLTVSHNIFAQANGFPAGAVLNSILRYDGKLYLVSNLSARVEVADEKTLESVGFADGFQSPRYIAHWGNSRLAVSDWNSNTVRIIDANSLQTIKTLSTGNGPERLYTSFLYAVVLNSGGFGSDSTLSLFDINTLESVGTRQVAPVPNSMVLAGGRYWLLCSGIPNWSDPTLSKPGALLELDATTLEVLKTHPISLSIGHPGDLVFNKSLNKLMFLSNSYGGAIMQSSLGDAGNFEIFKAGTYYSLAYDEIRNHILAGNALSFAEQGWVVRIPQNGTPLDSFQVGLIPTDFAIR